MDDYGVAGPFRYAISDGSWHDLRRDRQLPFRRYQPLGSSNSAQILFSPGLTGSPASASRWLSHWASWGLCATIVQHPETADPAPVPTLLSRLQTAMHAGALAVRAEDIRFALDRLDAGGNIARIGLAGHSLGAITALRLLGEAGAATDPRIGAAVLFSPSARDAALPIAERFGKITLPCLNLTGSRDHGVGRGDIRAENRCLPFAHMPPPHKYLLVLDGANHGTLAGDERPAATRRPRDAANERCDRLLRAASTAFWLAHLEIEPAAADWLDHSFARSLDVADRFEQK